MILSISSMFISILKANFVTMNSPISETGSGGGGGENKHLGVYLRVCGNTISTNMSFASKPLNPFISRYKNLL